MSFSKQQGSIKIEEADNLAGPAGVGVSRMHICVWGTQEGEKEGKRRKGSPSLLTGSADAFAILSGRHDQNPRGKRIWKLARNWEPEYVCVSVCACRHLRFCKLQGLKNNLFRLCQQPPPTIRDYRCVGVCVQCPGTRKMFPHPFSLYRSKKEKKMLTALKMCQKQLPPQILKNIIVFFALFAG